MDTDRPHATENAGMTIPVRPLFTYLEESARSFADHPCTDFLGRCMSYREIAALTAHAAAGFQNLGVIKGTRVALCLPNTPYTIIAYFSVLKAGGVVVNLNPLYTERELAEQIKDSGAEILLTLDLAQLAAKADGLLAATGLRRVILCPMRDALPLLKSLLYRVFKSDETAPIPHDATHMSFAELLECGKEFHPPDIDPHRDIAVLQYTGGTTGTPKAAILTHANLSANVEQAHAIFPGMRLGEERILAVLPFFHVFAMTVVMNLGIKTGAELILLPRFTLNEVLRTIDDKRPTLFPGVPTIFTAINNAPHLNQMNLSSLRYGISGGAPLPVEVKKRFESLSGCTLVEGYGLTEASPVALSNPVEGLNKPGSIGLPLPGTTIDIRDLETGAPLAVGEKGELCIKGPQVMMGYLNRPEETAATLIDGWLRTGDVGYRDADGYVFLVDRIKELIICSGFKVYPRVIEDAIHRHPAVEEVAVIGIPDEYRGQTPKAFIKLRQGMSLTQNEVIDFLKPHLSPIEMPKAVEFRDFLPKTLIGKLSKKELAREA